MVYNNIVMWQDFIKKLIGYNNHKVWKYFIPMKQLKIIEKSRKK